MAYDTTPQPVAIIRNVGGLVFDAVFEETHSSDLVVTDNPVETGVTVSDHAYMSPLKLTLSAGVTDTPLSVSPNDPFVTGTSRAKTAFEMLRELQRKAEPLDVQTGLMLYSNMVITSVQATQDKDTSGAFIFKADIREVIIVSTETITYPPRKAGATKRQADKSKDKGEQQGKEPSTAPKKASLVKKLLSVGGK